jgi:hypothetical protein
MQVLAALDAFRTIEQHAEHLAARFPELTQMTQPRLKAFIAQARDFGGLVEHEVLIANCSHDEAPANPEPVSWITIPTAGRTDLLSRALSSYLANANTFSRKYRFFIAGECDITVLHRAAGQTSHARKSGIVHAGNHEKSTFARQLIQQTGAPSEIVRACLFGFDDGAVATGANRNVILLQTVGSAFISVDDDTVCEAAVRDSYTENLRVLGHEDPQKFRPFASRDEIMEHFRFEPRDWVSDHERLLGQRPSAVISAFAKSGAPVDLNGMCSHLLEMLTTGDGRIVMSLSGAVGDSGMHTGASLLVHPDPETRGRLISDSHERFHQLLHSREIVRQSRGYALSHATSSCQTMFAGFDNRAILPPFFPSYRNQDGIFALVTSLCIKSSCFAHVPLVMQHLPYERRIYRADRIGGLRVCDWVMAACSIWSAGPAMKSHHRMKSLGWHLEALGGLPDREFRATLMPTFIARLAAIFGQAENALRAQDHKPAYWVREVEAFIEAHAAAATDPGYLTVSDIDDSRIAQPIQHLRMMIRTYGTILTWWPEIVQGARELSARGCGIGREII